MGKRLDSAQLREAADCAEARARAARARLETSVAKARVRAMSLAFGEASTAGGRGGLGDYDGARRTRLNRGRRPRSTSADAQLDGATLDELRALSQQLMRNSPVARAMIRRRVDRVVGPGPILQCTSGDDEWDARAEAAFGIWAERFADARGLVSLGAMLRTAYAARLVDGDCGIIMVAPARPEAAGDAPENDYNVMGLQLVEAQRIAGPERGDAVPDGHTLWKGVECDRLGRPVAFWVRDWDRVTGGSGGTLAASATRVPVEQFLFICDALRPGQTRGEPRLAAVGGLIEQITGYIQATAVSASIGASPALIFKRHDPAVAQQLLPGETVPRSGATNGPTEDRMLELQMGMNFFLSPDESVEQFKPEQPTQSFDAFVRMLLRLCGNELDEPLEMLLLDHSQATAYAGRQALATTRSPVEVDRRELLEHCGCRRIYRQVIGLMMAEGVLPWNDQWHKHAWVWPSDPTFEPDREAQADELRLRSNFTTLDKICKREGADWRDVLKQRAEEERVARDLGLAPSVNDAAARQDRPEDRDGAGGDEDGEDGEDGDAAGAGSGSASVSNAARARAAGAP